MPREEIVEGVQTLLVCNKRKMSSTHKGTTYRYYRVAHGALSVCQERRRLCFQNDGVSARDKRRLVQVGLRENPELQSEPYGLGEKKEG